MIKKEKYHFEPNQVKLDILDFILKSNKPISEPEIREHLNRKYGGINQSNVNRPLHWLYEKGCVELEKSRSNIWGVKTLNNLKNILVQYPDFVGSLQNSELALKIIINMHSSLITNANEECLNKISELESQINECTERWKQHLKYSIDFFKLFLHNEPDNLADRINILAQISGDDWSSSSYKVKN